MVRRMTRSERRPERRNERRRKRGVSMLMACLDLEGVLIPEIWIAVAETTGIEKLPSASVVAVSLAATRRSKSRQPR